jgi:hypothetical protein
MAMEKQKRLVDLLLQRTKQSHLDWHEAIASNAFQVALSDTTVRIRATPTAIADEEGVHDYWIDLVNGNGTVVDTFSDMNLHYDTAVRTGEWFGKMRDLHDMARRKALRSDEVLDQVLSELSDDKVPF